MRPTLTYQCHFSKEQTANMMSNSLEPKLLRILVCNWLRSTSMADWGKEKKVNCTLNFLIKFAVNGING